MDLDCELIFAVEKLELKPGDSLVVRSNDITGPEVTQALQEKFGCQVLMLGADDDVSVLSIQPGDSLVVKSNDIDVDVVKALREKFGCQVLGLGPNDDVATITIKSEDTLIVKGPNIHYLDQETRDEIEATMVKKLGCKNVLFLGDDVEVYTQGETVVAKLVRKIKEEGRGPRPDEPPWCSPLKPCTDELCHGGKTCCCNCHMKE